jgi:hypothetical protein
MALSPVIDGAMTITIRDTVNGNSPLLAQSGRRAGAEQCPLSGVKRTSRLIDAMSAFDPKQTWRDYASALLFVQSSIGFIRRRLGFGALGLAQSGHPTVAPQCPLLRKEQIWRLNGQNVRS